LISFACLALELPSDLLSDQQRTGWSYNTLFPEAHQEMEKRRVRLLLNGFGNVNRLLVQLIIDKVGYHPSQAKTKMFD
jgi:hypothetical protein